MRLVLALTGLSREGKHWEHLSTNLNFNLFHGCEILEVTLVLSYQFVSQMLRLRCAWSSTAADAKKEVTINIWATFDGLSG
jgi:hypothetical protein